VAGAAQRPPPHVSPQVEGGSECAHDAVLCRDMGDQSRVFVRKLLIWYKKAARCLPWRDTRNPYAILVSEFMLQQTQVSRVLEYYPRFMADFPRSTSWPRAPQSGHGTVGGPRLLRASEKSSRAGARWSARHTTAGFRITPTCCKSCRVSDGTRQARWHCFAYEKPVPAVDTNVRRVLTRVFGNAKVGMPNAELWSWPRDSPRSTAARMAIQSGDDGARRPGLYGEEAEMPAMSGEPPLCSSSVRDPNS